MFEPQVHTLEDIRRSMRTTGGVSLTVAGAAEAGRLETPEVFERGPLTSDGETLPRHCSRSPKVSNDPCRYWQQHNRLVQIAKFEPSAPGSAPTPEIVNLKNDAEQIRRNETGLGSSQSDDANNNTVARSYHPALPKLSPHQKGGNHRQETGEVIKSQQTARHGAKHSSAL